MWVIKQTRYYSATKSQKEMTVTSYFQHLGMFVCFTSNIDNGKRFPTKTEAKRFVKTHFNLRPTDVIEYVDVGSAEQKERF